VLCLGRVLAGFCCCLLRAVTKVQFSIRLWCILYHALRCVLAGCMYVVAAQALERIDTEWHTRRVARQQQHGTEPDTAASCEWLRDE
jgi:hypothetical protein